MPRRIVLTTMFLVALALFLFAQAVNAQSMVARQGADEVRFFETPCTSELVLQRLQPEVHEMFQRATATFQGQEYNACWRMMGNAFYLVYEDGDQGLVPTHEVKPVKNV